MSAVFLDTVGVLALLDLRDQWHDAASKAWSEIVSSGADFVTTSLVLIECANAASRRPYRRAIANLRESMTAAQMVIDPLPEEWEQAWAQYAAESPGASGVVDHLSFLVMRRLQILAAFTNDRHFLRAGFDTLF